MDPVIHSAFHDLSRSLTPLSSASDSNDEVDRLLVGPATPEPTTANYCVDEESDLSPLTSSDEEDIDATPRPIKLGRTLRPRVAKGSTSAAEHAAPAPRALSPPVQSPSAAWPSTASRKRKRTEDLTVETPSAMQEKKPKPGPYVSEDRCHQCRNRPRYAFMRCTSNDEYGRPCRKLFCASCVTKRFASLSVFASYFWRLTDCNRYPDDINFDPRLKKWECPFCRNTCNCTKCCFRRNVKYISTSSTKIDHDTLLYYATLMPRNSNTGKRPPPPRKPSKPSNKSSKPAKKPTSNPAKIKPGVSRSGIVRDVDGDPMAARDVESILRGLSDTAAMFEKFGCFSGQYWGVVFSNIDAVRIGVAYIGDQLPEIFILKDEECGGLLDEPSPPPTKRPRVSSRTSA